MSREETNVHQGDESPPAEASSKQLDDISQDDSNKLDQVKPSTQVLPQTKLTLLLTSVFTSMFLVSLDRMIISTAIPRITDDFNSLPDVGWYGSAYLLTSCSFQLLFGKVYQMLPLRDVFLASVLLFEVASAICGAAPNSTTFIIGRALAGVGAAGIFAGTIMSLVKTVPLKDRPKLQGLFGALFGISSIIGPLLGGVFTSKISWRWCFYINLPFGAVAMIVVAFCLDAPKRDSKGLPWTKKLLSLDPLGAMALIPGIICLVLALQWGGQTYAWSNGRVVAVLTLMGALLAAFVAIQICLPKTAMAPLRVFKQRSLVSGVWASFCINASLFIYSYYLPLWFQSIKGVTALDSGVRLLPMMLSIVFGAIIAGSTTPKHGYYTAPAIIGSSIMAIGSGLLTTLHVDTSEGRWIGYQVVYGLGLGLCFQQPNLAAQTVLPTSDVPVGMAIMLFSGLLSGAIFISVGENVLGNQLIRRLSGVPGFEPSLVTSGGATSLLNLLAANQRAAVLPDYNEALRAVFQIGLIMACLTFLGTSTLEWKSILKKPEDGADAEQVNVDHKKQGKTGKELEAGQTLPHEGEEC